MSQHEEFITWVHTVLRAAEVAVLNGDASPRRAIWSSNDPVTVLRRTGRYKRIARPAVPGERTRRG